jgi:hypothetical protein
MSFSKDDLFPDTFLNLTNLHKYVPPGTVLVIIALTVEAIGETRTPKPVLASPALTSGSCSQKGATKPWRRCSGRTPTTGRGMPSHWRSAPSAVRRRSRSLPHARRTRRPLRPDSRDIAGGRQSTRRPPAEISVASGQLA